MLLFGRREKRTEEIVLSTRIICFEEEEEVSAFIETSGFSCLPSCVERATSPVCLKARRPSSSFAHARTRTTDFPKKKKKKKGKRTRENASLKGRASRFSEAKQDDTISLPARPTREPRDEHTGTERTFAAEKKEEEKVETINAST
jgi:hypothetical protein